MAIRWAVVTERLTWGDNAIGMPVSSNRLRNALKRVGLDLDEGHFTTIVKTPGDTPTTKVLNAAAPDFLLELQALPDLQGVLVLGNGAMRVLGGVTGVVKHRGMVISRSKVFEGFTPVVFATLHPSVVERSPGYVNGWMADLAGFSQLVNPVEDTVLVYEVNSEATFRSFQAEVRPTGTLDIETTIGNLFLEPVSLISIGMSFDGDVAWVVRPGPWIKKVLPLIRDVEWTMHNGLFDTLYLTYLLGWTPILRHDTMALQYLINSDERKGLEILASINLGMAPYKTVDYKNIATTRWEHIRDMNGRDAVATHRLFRPLADRVNAMGPRLIRTYRQLVMPALPALTKVTLRGVPVDRERLEALSVAVKAEHEATEAALVGATPSPQLSKYPKGWPKGGFNPASTKQVGHILYDVFELPITDLTEKGVPSTAAATLDGLIFYAEEIPAAWLGQLRAHRATGKLLNGYLTPWPKLVGYDGRMHPRYKPLHVVTGRLASEGPNIQQVPRDPRFRAVFGGVEGMTWVKADLSQIELRVAAWMAEEHTMLDAFEWGHDLHARTAELVLGDPARRQAGKALNFSLLYGAYPAKLQEIAYRDYGVVLSAAQAETYRDRFFETYPGLAHWHARMAVSIKNTCQSVSPLGRVRHLPEAKSSEWGLVNRAVREGINHPVQSFASDLLLMSLIRVEAQLPGLVIASVHDELDLLVPDERVDDVVAQVRGIMENVSWTEDWGLDFYVPVSVDITTGRYWNGD